MPSTPLTSAVETGPTERVGHLHPLPAIPRDSELSNPLSFRYVESLENRLEKMEKLLRSVRDFLVAEPHGYPPIKRMLSDHRFINHSLDSCSDF